MRRGITTGLWATGLSLALAGCDRPKESSPAAIPTKTEIPTAAEPLPVRDPGVADPVVQVPRELDALLAKAQADAMDQWDTFEKSFRNPARFSQHSVKVALPTKDGGEIGTEHIWVWVTSIDGETIGGKIANDPAHDIGYRLNDAITIQKPDVEDWLIFIPPETQIGGFSVKVIQEYGKNDQKPK